MSGMGVFRVDAGFGEGSVPLFVQEESAEMEKP